MIRRSQHRERRFFELVIHSSRFVLCDEELPDDKQRQHVTKFDTRVEEAMLRHSLHLLHQVLIGNIIVAFPHGLDERLRQKSVAIDRLKNNLIVITSRELNLEV
jgi:hypothetical protein